MNIRFLLRALHLLPLLRCATRSAACLIDNPEIVRTITTLAHTLSMKTTAEGVETREQCDELRALNCH